MDKQKLEDMLSNGAVCGQCHACDYCGETGCDCRAIVILKELTGYPGFDHSQISSKKEMEK